jgi:hypothetical protein
VSGKKAKVRIASQSSTTPVGFKDEFHFIVVIYFFFFETAIPGLIAAVIK